MLCWSVVGDTVASAHRSVEGFERSVLGMGREDRPPGCVGLNYSRARDYGEYAGESVAPQWGRDAARWENRWPDYRVRVVR